MLNSTGFDLWADGYDKSVNLSEENNEYPFAGYKEVLNYIYREVRVKERADVLDIGFGTGILTTKLYDADCNITGIDFSNNMIEIVKEKMPNAKLINWDFSCGLPNEIEKCNFDYIISTYAFHHLKDEEKVDFVKSLFSLLNKEGKILIGDISFETRGELENCKAKYSEYWDDDEIYFITEEIEKKLRDEYKCEYVNISHCAGILIVSKSVVVERFS